MRNIHSITSLSAFCSFLLLTELSLSPPICPVPRQKVMWRRRYSSPQSLTPYPPFWPRLPLQPSPPSPMYGRTTTATTPNLSYMSWLPHRHRWVFFCRNIQTWIFLHCTAHIYVTFGVFIFLYMESFSSVFPAQYVTLLGINPTRLFYIVCTV